MTRSNGGPGSDFEGDGTGRGNGQSDGRKGDVPELPGGRRLKKIAGSSSSLAGRAYQGAMEAVLAIVIATGLGYWADARFGTSPRWLIVGAIVGFGAFVLRLARMAKLVEDPTQDEDEDEEPRD